MLRSLLTIVALLLAHGEIANGQNSGVNPPAVSGALDGVAIEGTATHYGSRYEGLPLGCGGLYRGDDPTIAAVSPARYVEWPCNTRLEVCARLAADNDGAGGLALDGDQGLPSLFCIAVVRTDSCPGCGANNIDLSEAGLSAICPDADICPVSIWRLAD